MAWLKDRAPGLHRFLTRTDRPYPIVREVLGVVLGLLLLLVVLFALTGQNPVGGYPVVVVTSGSMMHCDNSNGNGYPSIGRDCDLARVGGLGFIDPGDLVFVRDIDEPDDITTMAEDGRRSYGEAGDVVVYFENGQTARTPIIHRALFWLQVNSDGTFSVPALGIDRVDSLDDPRIQALTKCVLPTTLKGHAVALRPVDSGFITKGDNNREADQCEPGLPTGPVRTEWILGKARGELPWIGLIKLFVDDVGGHSSNYANANGSAKGFLFVAVAVLVAGPWAVERVRKKRRKGPPAT